MTYLEWNDFMKENAENRNWTSILSALFLIEIFRSNTARNQLKGEIPIITAYTSLVVKYNWMLIPQISIFIGEIGFRYDGLYYFIVELSYINVI